MKKLVLAYSGGLDTSYCAMYLTKKRNFEVHAVSVNTGGFEPEEIAEIKKKALELGAVSYTSIDAVKTFYDKVVKYLIFGNVLKNNTYPLSVSAERIIQAIEIVNYAKKIGAGYIAHGSTGAGNDQVRFDMIFQILAPELKIVTPIRDMKLQRHQEIEFLQENGVDYSWEKAKYSINQGLWGTSVGGEETLTSHLHLPEEAFPSQLKEKAPNQITLTFEKGEPVAIDGEKAHPVEIIEKLNRMGAGYAIGRDIHVGDTIIGIKGRVGFEAPAPMMIIKAHHLLEKHNLTKWQLMHKDQLANWYGMMIHEGQYLDEVVRNFEAFLKDSQRYVSGDVYVEMYPYRFRLNGVSSSHDLMDASFASYGESNEGWTADDVKGFIRISSMQNIIFNQVNKSK